MLKQPTNFAYNDLHSPPNGQSGAVVAPQSTDHSIGSVQKQSMLEKFKLFNREKTERAKQQQIAKRTSSSSGFSSAKSERSDSSLSLNEHQQQGHQGQPHTPTSAGPGQNGFGSHRNSTGASVLMRKSESHSLRLSSKVKCPSQSPSTSNLSRLSTGSGSEKGTLKHPSKSGLSKSVTNGKQVNGKESTAGGVPKPKQIPGSLKLEPRPVNGSKTNSLPRGSSGRSGTLPSPGMSVKGSAVVVNPVNASTGIPKPMAAIKGTSKIPMNGPAGASGTSEESRMNVVKPQTQQQQGFNTAGYYVQNMPGTEKEGNGSKVQIMNSMEVEIQDDSSKNYNNIINAVMGKSSGGAPLGMTDSTNSSSTSTTGLFSNSSESSVIFRPGSDSGGSEMRSQSMQQSSPLRNVIPNRKMDKFSAQEQMSLNKYHTAPMFKATTPAAMNGHGNVGENGKTTNGGMSLRMEDFGSNVTLPSRGPRGQRQFTLAQPSYAVDLQLGKNSGYLSDGDAFRKIGTKPFLTAYNVDIENGYLSDGCNPNRHMMNVIRRRQMLPTTIEER